MMDAASDPWFSSTVGCEDHVLWPCDPSSSIPSLFRGRFLDADLFAWLALFPLPSTSLLQCHQLAAHPSKRYPSFHHHQNPPAHPPPSLPVILSFVARRWLDGFPHRNIHYPTTTALVCEDKILRFLCFITVTTEPFRPFRTLPPLFRTLIGHKHSSGARRFFNTVTSFSFLHSDYCYIH